MYFYRVLLYEKEENTQKKEEPKQKTRSKSKFKAEKLISIKCINFKRRKLYFSDIFWIYSMVYWSLSEAEELFDS